MSGDEINIFKDIGLPIFIGIITTGICGFLIYFCQQRVRIFLRSHRIKIFNENFKIRLFYKFSFAVNPEPMSIDIFETLKNRFPQYELSKISIRPDLLVLKSNILGGRINAQISSLSESLSVDENESNSDLPSIFELEISLGDDLRLGYKQLNDLLGYLIIFGGIKDIVKSCSFNNTQEINGFIVCDVVRNFDPICKEKKINLVDKNATITFTDKTMKVVLKNYEYLEKIISDYIGY
ncbi:MAG TPA: hypothetical protein HA272_01170 [Methanoregula sp.]|nr:hypothetical protein [Methanoregula sp.]